MTDNDPNLIPAAGDEGDRTRCEHCGTVFRVPERIMGSRDTRVRCGECLGVFDAREQRLSEAAPEGSDADDFEQEGLDLPIPEDAAIDSPPPDDTPDDLDDSLVDPGDLDHNDPDKPAAASLTGLSGEADWQGIDALDQTFADFDLFSEEADLPDVAYEDRPLSEPHMDFAAVEAAHDETIDEALFEGDMTLEGADGSSLEYELGDVADSILPGPDAVRKNSAKPAEPVVDKLSAPVEFLQGPPPSEALKLHYPGTEASAGEEVRAQEDTAASRVRTELPEAAAWRRPIPADVSLDSVGPMARSRRWLFRSVVALSLLIILGLFGWRERARILENQQLRPLLVQACEFLQCTVPPRVATEAFRALSRKIVSHPDVPDALIIEVVFRNTATFEQPYPVLRVRLSDVVGRIVAARDFLPSEYDATWSNTKLVQPGQRLDISLEVGDPGREASSLNLQFASLSDYRAVP